MRDYIKKVIIGKHEQGYQAMKEDKGNYVDGKLIGTKFGISAPVLKRYLGRTPTVQDMKNLKLESALDILENQYYKGPKIDKLPISIRKNVLDMAINAGPGRAIKILH
jgi:lysozyme family protein